MSKPKRFCSISLVIAFAFSTAAAHPQRGSLPGRPSGGDPTADGTIEGRIVLPSGQPVASGVKIILSTVTSEGITLYTDNNGGFSFKNLRAGNYSIEATGDTKLYDPASEKVRLIRGGRVHLVLHLKEKDTSAEKKPGSVISVAEVDQSVPAQAKQAYDKATRLAHEGRHEEAITEYKQAIARHPAYLVAHNDLGVQYLKLKRHAEAAEHFEAAIEINPKAFNPRLNLGIALVEQKKYFDAIDQLNQAVSIDSSSAAARLYLGIVSVETDDLEKAARELQTALSVGGEQFWAAHFYLAHVHMKNGERDAAIRELNTYLEKPTDSELAGRARLLLERIK